MKTKKSQLDGSQQFSNLCEELINNFPYLYPEVSRTRQTEWMAFIFQHQSEDRKVKMAEGQSVSMDGACLQCVEDYHNRLRIETRKQELLTVPVVVEALNLFDPTILKPNKL